MTPADRATLLHAADLIDEEAAVILMSHVERTADTIVRRYKDMIRTAKRLRKIVERERG